MKQLLDAARRQRILVVGDVMLDHYLWGKVRRISPEAPVPVVEFDRESYVPGGAGNVARNLADLGAFAELLGVIGEDEFASKLKKVLKHEHIYIGGLLQSRTRPTSVKTRIVAHQQQVVRVDRESRNEIDPSAAARLLENLKKGIQQADAVILCDYAKGVFTQELLDLAKSQCRQRGIPLSLDPKPSNRLALQGVSLLTPNRKEAFELAGMADNGHGEEAANDPLLLEVAERLLAKFIPDLLLITLGNQGMLLCRRGKKPFHVPTFAREVYDVSGAGDTVIASFTLAVAAGAEPEEAAIFSNHAAGIVVGKVGTATVTPEEMLK